MTYDETLNYINRLHKYSNALTITSTKQLLELLGNPQKQLKFVHVAGTNGKGSVCAMLSSIFQKAGYKTGLFTTPYLNRFNEIMRVNGEPISDNEFVEIAERAKCCIPYMKYEPTRFGMATAIGIEFFKRNNCDIVILETGLGGEFDATNVIDNPEAIVITAIDIDHTRVLGSTMENIAEAKAGIIKPNCDVIFYGENPTASTIISNRCNSVGARYYEVDEATRWASQFYSSNLIGLHQTLNRALVLKTLDVLQNKYSISYETITEGLKNTKWPGRFETLLAEPTFIFDGAHNPHGVKAAMETLNSNFRHSKVILIMGVMRDKDVEGMVNILVRNVDVIHTVTPDHHRAMDAFDLARIFTMRSHGQVYTSAHDKIKDAVYEAIQEAKKEPDSVILALGSFHIYKDIVDAIKTI